MFPLHSGIMVTWSPEDVDVGVQSLLVQIYTILLSTLLSINRQQLSKFDAGFALLVSSSPLTVYIVVASISDLCGINTGLYKRIKSHRHIVRALGASVLLLWTGLSMTVNLSSRAFKDSSCGVSTFPEWLRDTARSLWISLWAPGVVGQFGNALLSIMWMICWVRRRSRLTMYAKLSSGEASKLRQLWMLLKCPWCVPVVGSRLAKSNTSKAHDRPPPQVVYLLPVRVSRRRLGIPDYLLRR